MPLTWNTPGAGAVPPVAGEDRFYNIKYLPFVHKEIPRAIENVDNIYLKFNRESYVTSLATGRYDEHIDLILEKENVKLSCKNTEQLNKYRFLYKDYYSLITELKKDNRLLRQVM